MNRRPQLASGKRTQREKKPGAEPKSEQPAPILLKTEIRTSTVAAGRATEERKTNLDRCQTAPSTRRKQDRPGQNQNSRARETGRRKRGSQQRIEETSSEPGRRQVGDRRNFTAGSGAASAAAGQQIPEGRHLARFRKTQARKTKSNRPKIEKDEQRLRWASELHRRQKRHGNEKSVASLHPCAEIESSTTKMLSERLKQKKANQPLEILDPARRKNEHHKTGCKKSLFIEIITIFLL
jgi:hypothetical protein